MPRTKHVTGKATSVKTTPPAVGYVQQKSPLPGLRSQYDTLPKNRPSRESVLRNRTVSGGAPVADASSKKVRGWKEPINKRNKRI